MDNTGKAKNQRGYQTPKPYDRRKSLLGRVSESVKEMLAPSWLVDLVHSVKKKTPPPNERTSTSEPRQVTGGNIYGTARINQQQQSASFNHENGMGQDSPAQFSSQIGSYGLNVPPIMRNTHFNRNSQPQYINTANIPQTEQNLNFQPSTREQAFNAGQMMSHAGSSQLTTTTNQQAPAQFTSENLPFGGLNKIDINSGLLVNGGDDHSEMSEFSGASPCLMTDKSSCDQLQMKAESSRIHQMRQEYGGSVTPSKEIEERGIANYSNEAGQSTGQSFLWSGVKKHEREEYDNPAPPAKRHKPSFNVSLFGANYSTLSSDGPNYDSSFYPGKTMFGGAASHRKNRPKQATPRAMTPKKKKVPTATLC